MSYFDLLGRDNCEAELGFDYATASDGPFEQLQRAAQELRNLRRFRAAWAKLVEAAATTEKKERR